MTFRGGSVAGTLKPFGEGVESDSSGCRSELDRILESDVWLRVGTRNVEFFEVVWCAEEER